MVNSRGNAHIQAKVYAKSSFIVCIMTTMWVYLINIKIKEIKAFFFVEIQYSCQMRYHSTLSLAVVIRNIIEMIQRGEKRHEVSRYIFQNSFEDRGNE